MPRDYFHMYFYASGSSRRLRPTPIDVRGLAPPPRNVDPPLSLHSFPSTFPSTFSPPLFSLQLHPALLSHPPRARVRARLLVGGGLRVAPLPRLPRRPLLRRRARRTRRPRRRASSSTRAVPTRSPSKTCVGPRLGSSGRSDVAKRSTGEVQGSARSGGRPSTLSTLGGRVSSISRRAAASPSGPRRRRPTRTRRSARSGTPRRRRQGQARLARAQAQHLGLGRRRGLKT